MTSTHSQAESEEEWDFQASCAIVELEPVEERTSNKSPEKAKSPWRTGVHQQTPEEARASQLEEIQ